MKPHCQIAGFILAGGLSSRMGTDKGLLRFGCEPLLLHTARLLQQLVVEVTIVGSPGIYAALGLPTIPDEPDVRAHEPGKPGRGPLAGIAAALSATHSEWNLIVACDLPYLSAAWIDWLLSRALLSRAEALIPRTEQGIEPLAAVYRRECGAPIAAALARGIQRVSEAIAELRVENVYPHEWRDMDPHGLILRNMNTPEDYAGAQKWWALGHLERDRPLP